MDLTNPKKMKLGDLPDATAAEMFLAVRRGYKSQMWDGREWVYHGGILWNPEFTIRIKPHRAKVIPYDKTNSDR